MVGPFTGIYNIYVSLIRTYVWGLNSYNVYVSTARQDGTGGDFRDQFLTATRQNAYQICVYNNWAGSDRGSLENWGNWCTRGY